MEKQEFTYIYGLMDPQTHEIFYVGRSNRPVVKKHKNRGFLTRRVLRNEKERWIYEIEQRGEHPEPVILEQVPIEEWYIKRIDWIYKLLRQGHPVQYQVPESDPYDRKYNPTEYI